MSARSQTKKSLNRRKLKLTDLRHTYISKLEHSIYPNPDYRSGNPKSKLEKYEPYKDKLPFCDKGKSSFIIVYSSEIDVDTTVKHAYQLGSTDMIENAGSYVS